jgi:hypothetical protein
MLIDKWTLLRGVTLEASQVDSFLFQEFATSAAVGVMAFRAKHFSFRHRVVERQIKQGSNLRVTPVTNQRFIHRHRHPSRPIDLIVVNIRDLWHPAAWVRVVAIGAGHVLQRMRGGCPCHGGVALVAAQAHIYARLPVDVVMRIVAGNALEAIDAIDLMGMRDLLEFHLFIMALVAGAWFRCSQFRQRRMRIMTIDAGHTGLRVA